VSIASREREGKEEANEECMNVGYEETEGGWCKTEPQGGGKLRS